MDSSSSPQVIFFLFSPPETCSQKLRKWRRGLPPAPRWIWKISLVVCLSVDSWSYYSNLTRWLCMRLKLTYSSQCTSRKLGKSIQCTLFLPLSLSLSLSHLHTYTHTHTHTHTHTKNQATTRSSSTLCGTNRLLLEIILKSFLDPFCGRDCSAHILQHLQPFMVLTIY